MRDGFLGNGGERNELSEMWSVVARGSRVLPLVRNSTERDRPPHAPGGTGREQGSRRRDHGARPRGERTPTNVRQGGPDLASRRRGQRADGQGSRGQDRRGREAGGHEGDREDRERGPQDP